MNIYCENCGTELEIHDSQAETQVKCPNCGTVFTPDGTEAANPAAKIVADATGLDAVHGFSWGGLFSETFKRHSDDELEAHWSAGSVGNIPSIVNVETSWPKPWMFMRIFLLSLISFGLLYFCWAQWKNPNVLPGLILVGSFAVPLALVIFFFEMNARRNISLYMTLKTFIVGGILSLIISLFMFQFTSAAGLDWLGASVAGIAEETGKLAAVILFIHTVRYPYILNGLLFGAAVGAGFAAFESAGYALMNFVRALILATVDNSEKIVQAVNSAGENAQEVFVTISEQMTQFGAEPMFGSIMTRAFWCGIAGHILWTGMSAGALWLVKGNRKFQFSMLLDIRFLRVFLIAVASHMIWNSPWEPELFSKYDKFILLGIICWAVIFAMIQSGLNQLKREKAQYIAEPEKEPEVANIIRIQTVYVETLRSAPSPRECEEVNISGYDHLGIAEQVEESKIKEENREKPSFSARAWQKYYRKDGK